MGKQKDHSRTRERLPRFCFARGDCETVALKVQGRRFISMKITQADRSEFWDIPKDTKFNQDYFIDTVLPNLYSEKRGIARGKGLPRFSVRMDNSVCQNGAKITEKLEKRTLGELLTHLTRQTSAHVTFGSLGS
jgi:hypothetical protein